MRTAGLSLASCSLLLALLSFGAQGHGRHTGTESHSRQRATATAVKAAQCFAAENGARQRPSPGCRAKASSGERLGFAWTNIRTPPPPSSLVTSLSFSLLCSYPSPQPPPDSPLNVELCCLPCLLLSSSRFPCKRTSNNKSSAF
jgi:hypothetical protein